MSPLQLHLIKPDGFSIARSASAVHGISNEEATKHGVPFKPVLDAFLNALSAATTVVAHNIEFDDNIVGAGDEKTYRGP